MNMTNLMTQLQETAQFIQSKITAKADTAIILGSGLGNLSTKIETEFENLYCNYNMKSKYHRAMLIDKLFQKMSFVLLLFQ